MFLGTCSMRNTLIFTRYNFVYLYRIEQVILDLAKNYYVAQAKSVKSHKDQLNKSSQIYLYIRHEFKLAFFHEIRQIYNTALG